MWARQKHILKLHLNHHLASLATFFGAKTTTLVRRASWVKTKPQNLQPRKQYLVFLKQNFWTNRIVNQGISWLTQEIYFSFTEGKKGPWSCFICARTWLFVLQIFIVLDEIGLLFKFAGTSEQPPKLGSFFMAAEGKGLFVARQQVCQLTSWKRDWVQVFFRTADIIAKGSRNVQRVGVRAQRNRLLQACLPWHALFLQRRYKNS